MRICDIIMCEEDNNSLISLSKFGSNWEVVKNR